MRSTYDASEWRPMLCVLLLAAAGATSACGASPPTNEDSAEEPQASAAEALTIPVPSPTTPPPTINRCLLTGPLISVDTHQNVVHGSCFTGPWVGLLVYDYNRGAYITSIYYHIWINSDGTFTWSLSSACGHDIAAIAWDPTPNIYSNRDNWVYATLGPC